MPTVYELFVTIHPTDGTGKITLVFPCVEEGNDFLTTFIEKTTGATVIVTKQKRKVNDYE